MALYIAGENIPAGHWVIHPDARFETVCGLDPTSSAALKPPLRIAIGIARENLREGFRVAVRDDGVYEDDA